MSAPDEDSDDADSGEYNSGPFCRHWGDPSDCDEKCAACNHECHSHRGECNVEDCTCLRWEEPE